MVTILNPLPEREGFGALIGRGLGELMQQTSSERLQKQALKDQEAQKMHLLEQEYALKGGLEDRKQEAKFQQQMKLLKQAGLDFNLGQDQQDEPMTASDVAMQATGLDMEPTKSGSKSKLIPQDKINAWALVNPAVADKMQQANNRLIEEERRQEDLKRKTFESERAYHTSFTKELEKEANELRRSLPRKEMALNFARNAVETGDVSFFSPDKLADATGLDLFRTAKGAQLVTAGKENLLSNMSRVSAKAQNQWFEQRLNSMFPKIGQSKDANLTVQEMLEGEAAIDKAYLEEFDRLVEKDEEDFGFPQKNIAQRAQKNISSLEKHILSRTSYRLKELEENEKGLSSMRKDVGKNVVKGTPLTLAMAKLYVDKFGKDKALEVAEKNGYRIPTPQEFVSYQERPDEFREDL